MHLSPSNSQHCGGHALLKFNISPPCWGWGSWETQPSPIHGENQVGGTRNHLFFQNQGPETGRVTLLALCTVYHSLKIAP